VIRVEARPPGRIPLSRSNGILPAEGLTLGRFAVIIMALRREHWLAAVV
jgi:hypothetical protein